MILLTFKSFMHYYSCCIKFALQKNCVAVTNLEMFQDLILSCYFIQFPDKFNCLCNSEFFNYFVKMEKVSFPHSFLHFNSYLKILNTLTTKSLNIINSDNIFNNFKIICCYTLFIFASLILFKGEISPQNKIIK